MVCVSSHAARQRHHPRRHPIASISPIRSRAIQQALSELDARAAGVFSCHCTCRLISVQAFREAALAAVDWLRGMDSNHRPSGYEPDELTAALPRKIQAIKNPARRPGRKKFDYGLKLKKFIVRWNISS